MDEHTISADPLALTLASLSWSGWNAGTVRLPGPWHFDVPEGRVSIYAIRHGRCRIDSPIFTQPVEARQGDVLIFPHGSAHSLQFTGAASGPGQADGRTEGNVGLSRDYRKYLRAHGNGRSGLSEPLASDVVEIVYGQLEKHPHGTEPLHANLSSFLHLNIGDYDLLRSSRDLFALMEDEQRNGRPGWQGIVNQYIQILFHQSLRAFVSRGADNHDGDATTSVPHAGLVTDPVIGLVVGLLHAQPDKPWTVASLAKWVNMSRSAFSERFREVVGAPPLHYLTELRMSRACELLQGSDLGVKQIAGLVGYESPSSFTNAFKRWHGTSPASYRVKAQAGDSAECVLCPAEAET